MSIAIALIGLLALPGYKTNYDSRKYLPSWTPANIGYAATDRHFSQARMNPELLLIETDHDLRNPAGMLIPPEVFDNPDFKRGLKMFMSPDGHAARLIISHEGDLATPEGISHVDPIMKAAKEAIKGLRWRVPTSGSAAPPRSSKICATGPSMTF